MYQISSAVLLVENGTCTKTLISQILYKLVEMKSRLNYGKSNHIWHCFIMLFCNCSRNIAFNRHQLFNAYTEQLRDESRIFEFDLERSFNSTEDYFRKILHFRCLAGSKYTSLTLMLFQNRQNDTKEPQQEVKLKSANLAQNYKSVDNIFPCQKLLRGGEFGGIGWMLELFLPDQEIFRLQ